MGNASFHTVDPEELIEETPVDSDDLDGETHQERYAAVAEVRRSRDGEGTRYGYLSGC